MSRPTFKQRLLGRPSQSYATATGTDLEQQQRASYDSGRTMRASGTGQAGTNTTYWVENKRASRALAVEFLQQQHELERGAGAEWADEAEEELNGSEEEEDGEGEDGEEEEGDEAGNILNEESESGSSDSDSLVGSASSRSSPSSNSPSMRSSHHYEEQQPSPSLLHPLDAEEVEEEEEEEETVQPASNRTSTVFYTPRSSITELPPFEAPHHLGLQDVHPRFVNTLTSPSLSSMAATKIAAPPITLSSPSPSPSLPSSPPAAVPPMTRSTSTLQEDTLTLFSVVSSSDLTTTTAQTSPAVSATKLALSSLSSSASSSASSVLHPPPTFPPSRTSSSESTRTASSSSADSSTAEPIPTLIVQKPSPILHSAQSPTPRQSLTPTPSSSTDDFRRHSASLSTSTLRPGPSTPLQDPRQRASWAAPTSGSSTPRRSSTLGPGYGSSPLGAGAGARIRSPLAFSSSNPALTTALADDARVEAVLRARRMSSGSLLLDPGSEGLEDDGEESTPIERKKSKLGRARSLVSRKGAQSTPNLSLPAPRATVSMRTIDEREQDRFDIPPDYTIGIPFSHPDTGLPMVSSILSTSRMTLAASHSSGWDEDNNVTSGGMRAMGSSEKLMGSVVYGSSLDTSAKRRRSTSGGSASSSGTSTPTGTGHRRTMSTAAARSLSTLGMSFIPEEGEDDSSSLTYELPHAVSEPLHLGANSAGPIPFPMGLTSMASMSSNSLPTIAHPHLPTHPPVKSATPSILSSAPTVHSLTSKTVDLPLYPSYAPSSSSTNLPSSSSAGEVSRPRLVLPRASKLNSDNALPRSSVLKSSKGSGRIEISRDGLVQGTMGSIEIVRGSSSLPSSTSSSFPFSASSPDLSRSRKRGSIFKSSGGGGGGGLFGRKETPTPAHLLRERPSPLAYAYRLAPPSRVGPREVLVEVLAVGLDGIDAVGVNWRLSSGGEGKGVGGGKGGAGYIPGRSFVGRVVESGFEISGGGRGERVGKGEVVFGLLDLVKSGALAEYITVPHRRVHHAPLPTSSLSLEQIALLPLCALPARRALRALHQYGNGHGDGVGSGKGGGGNGKRRALSALVFNAHDGAGALIAQALVARGVRVTAHVPSRSPPSNDVSFPSQPSHSAHLSDPTHQAHPDADEPTSLYEQRVRSFGPGIDSVLAGDVLDVLYNLVGERKHEGDDGFDFVFDTVGGRKIWEASGGVIRPGGMFTTLLGDTPHLPPTSTHPSLKSTFRSIRTIMRASASSYEWIPANVETDIEGEDVRDSLGAVAGMVGVGGVWGPRSSRPTMRRRGSSGRSLGLGLGMGGAEGGGGEGGDEAFWLGGGPVVEFEKTAEVFEEKRGLFRDGGLVVSRLGGGF